MNLDHSWDALLDLLHEKVDDDIIEGRINIRDDEAGANGGGDTIFFCIPNERSI